MIYIDPSENRSNSNLTKHLSDWHEIAGLEDLTGADMLIGAEGLPHPKNKFLLNMHLEKGAVLVQVKFGLDLLSSIFDGRFKSSQAKMLATGATPQQVILLFIAGVVMENHQSGILYVNGKPATDSIPQAVNFSWKNLERQKMLWRKRGGVFEHLQLAHKLNDWCEAVQETMNEPEEIKHWPVQQKIFLVDDWRNTLVSLPGIGSKKAHEIYEVHKSWPAFYNAVQDGSLKEIPGISTGIINKIKQYLGDSK